MVVIVATTSSLFFESKASLFSVVHFLYERSIDDVTQDCDIAKLKAVYDAKFWKTLTAMPFPMQVDLRFLLVCILKIRLQSPCR